MYCTIEYADLLPLKKVDYLKLSKGGYPGHLERVLADLTEQVFCVLDVDDLERKVQDHVKDFFVASFSFYVSGASVRICDDKSFYEKEK